MSIRAVWRGGSLAVIKSTSCRAERRSSCSRVRTSGSGAGGGEGAGASTGRLLLGELPAAGFFLDSAMHRNLDRFGRFANNSEKKAQNISEFLFAGGRDAFRDCPLLEKTAACSYFL